MSIKYIEDFIEASIQSEKALEEGNVRIANKNYDKQRKIVKLWENDPDMDMKALEPLLEHENNTVKLDIAFTLLHVSPEKARKTLEELASLERGGFASINAEVTLSELRKGHIKFE